MPRACVQCTCAGDRGYIRGYERQACAKKMAVIHIVSVSHSTPAGGAITPSQRVSSGPTEFHEVLSKASTGHETDQFDQNPDLLAGVSNNDTRALIVAN